MAILPGEPGLASFTGAKDDKGVVTIMSYIKRVKLHSQIVTTNKPTPNFSQARYHSCHPANNVGALKGKCNI